MLITLGDEARRFELQAPAGVSPRLLLIGIPEGEKEGQAERIQNKLMASSYMWSRIGWSHGWVFPKIDW